MGHAHADDLGVESSKVKSLIALVVFLVALVGILIKFDKMPGVHLGGATGRLELGFAKGELKRDSGEKQSGGANGGGDAAEVGELIRNDDLRLHGLFRTGRRALAIINDQTFAEGDVAKVDYRGEIIRLRCEQIRTNSVLVSSDRLNVELFSDGRSRSIGKTGSRSGVPRPASR